MKKIYTILTTCLLGILGNTAYSQSAQSSVLSNMVLNDAISIQATGVNQNATFSTITQYANGITNTNAVHLVVGATKGFKVDVKAGSANFSGLSVIAANKLLVRPGGIGSYTGLSTTDFNLYSDQTQGAAVPFDIDYYFNPGIGGYSAGTYTLNVTYTATLL